MVTEVDIYRDDGTVMALSFQFVTCETQRADRYRIRRSPLVTINKRILYFSFSKSVHSQKRVQQSVIAYSQSVICVGPS